MLYSILKKDQVCSVNTRPQCKDFVVGRGCGIASRSSLYETDYFVGGLLLLNEYIFSDLKVELEDKKITIVPRPQFRSAPASSKSPPAIT